MVSLKNGAFLWDSEKLWWRRMVHHSTSQIWMVQPNQHKNRSAFLGGFGRAILGLAALMLLLYLLVIYEEAKKNTIFQKWLLLDTVAGLWNGHENRPSQII